MSLIRTVPIYNTVKAKQLPTQHTKMWAPTGVPSFLCASATILALVSSTLPNGFKGQCLQCLEKKNCEDDLLPLFGAENALTILISDTRGVKKGN